jgi:Cu/Ag efflux pump CusA
MAARSGIQMVRHYQHLELEKGETFGDELVLRGTEERLQPTVVPAIVTILALIPVIVAGDVAGLEIARPMAIVMIGGFLTSALLTLFVLPSLYRMHGFVTERDTVAEDLVVLPESELDIEPVAGS